MTEFSDAKNVNSIFPNKPKVDTQYTPPNLRAERVLDLLKNLPLETSPSLYDLWCFSVYYAMNTAVSMAILSDSPLDPALKDAISYLYSFMLTIHYTDPSFLDEENAPEN